MSDYFRTDNGEVPATESKVRELTHKERRSLLLPKTRTDLDEVVAFMREDNRSSQHIRETEEIWFTRFEIATTTDAEGNLPKPRRKLTLANRVGLCERSVRFRVNEYMNEIGCVKHNNMFQFKEFSHKQKELLGAMLDGLGIPKTEEIRERTYDHEFHLYGVPISTATGMPVGEYDAAKSKARKRVENQFDHQYKSNLNLIMQTGEPRLDRTGVGTVMMFGTVQHHIDLRLGFPATTLKKLAFNTMKIETIEWMLQGKFDLQTLKGRGVRIWDQNVKPGTEVYHELSHIERVSKLSGAQIVEYTNFQASIFECAEITAEEEKAALENKLNNWGVPERVLVDGDLGPIYGKQWRAWEDIRVVHGAMLHGNNPEWAALKARGFDYVADLMETPYIVIKREIDQVVNVETAIKNELKFHAGEIDKHSEGRRIILTGWNVAQLDEMSLPPCHTMAQWSVSSTKDEEGRNYLDCFLFQRSADYLLGVPFNAAQYALITHMLAHVHGLTARHFHHSIGDAHVYKNHIEPDPLTGVSFAQEILDRPVVHDSPRLVIESDASTIVNIPIDGVRLEGYESYEAQKGVPIAK